MVETIQPKFQPVQFDYDTTDNIPTDTLINFNFKQ